MGRLEDRERFLKEQAIEMFGVIANATILPEGASEILLDGVKNYRDDHPAFDVVKAYRVARSTKFGHNKN